MPKVQAVSHDSGGGRRGRGPRVTTSLAEINVVPLVDVMLVLLIIFMVTAPMMQRGIDVKLPTSRRAAPISSEPLFVTVPLSYRTDQNALGERDVRIDCAWRALRRPCSRRPTRRCSCASTAAVTAQDIMDVIDRLKEAGVGDVGSRRSKRKCRTTR